MTHASQSQRALQWEWTLQVVLSFCLSFLMAFFWISFSFLACWAACLASSSSFSFCSRAASSSACRACWRECKLAGEQRDNGISGANCKGWLWGICVCVCSLETAIIFLAWITIHNIFQNLLKSPSLMLRLDHKNIFHSNIGWHLVDIRTKWVGKYQIK